MTAFMITGFPDMKIRPFDVMEIHNKSFRYFIDQRCSALTVCREECEQGCPY
jgi:hypothetical protein